MNSGDGVDELLSFATALAAEGADVLRNHLGQIRAITSKSSVSDIVTDVDRAVEAALIKRIAAERPGDGVVAEEGGYRESITGLTWVIDPIDGTANFAHGLPPFAVSVAACDRVDGPRLSTVAAVLNDPCHSEVFCATRGGGATLNGRTLSVPAPTELRTSLVATGFSHTLPIRLEEARALQVVLPAVGDVRRSGSGAVDLCWVAAGRLDCFYQADLKPWDYAAAQLIVTEAGGRFALLGPIGPGTVTIAAAAGSLYDSFRSLLRKAGIADAATTAARQ